MTLTDRVRVLSSEVLHQGWATLKSVTMELTRRDGRQTQMERLVLDHGDGAAVLLYDTARGMVLLVRQYRPAAFLGGQTEPMLEACAGKLDGDDPADCVRREAVEELGYRVTTLEPVGAFFSTPAVDQEKIHGFIAPYTPADRIAEGGGLEDEGEDIEVVEMAFDEAYGLIASDGMVDAKTIILLQHLKLSGRMG